MATSDKNPEQIAAEDRKADVTAILIIFTAILLGILHFASAGTFGF